MQVLSGRRRRLPELRVHGAHLDVEDALNLELLPLRLFQFRPQHLLRSAQREDLLRQVPGMLARLLLVLRRLVLHDLDLGPEPLRLLPQLTLQLVDFLVQGFLLAAPSHLSHKSPSEAACAP